MHVQIGELPERQPSPLEKFAPWIRRILILGCLLWAAFSIQTFSEDTVSHTIRISYPLLLNHATMTRIEPGFDPKKAVWKPLVTGFPVADGTVLFAKVGDATYAIKLMHQTVDPEQMTYEYLKVGTSDPVVKGVAETIPGGVGLPGAKIGWSGRSDGHGFLYLDDAFIYNTPPGYVIGVPFASGDLQNFRKALPAGVHFESVPWKIAEPDEEIIPVR